MGLSAENTFVLVLSLVSVGLTAEEEEQGVSKTYVKEGEDVVLQCSSGNSESLEDSVIQWKNKDNNEVFIYNRGRYSEDDWSVQYRGRVSLFYHELKNGNSSLILRNTRVEDKGIYTCSFSIRPGHLERFRMELIIEELFEKKSCNCTQHHDAEDRYTRGSDAGVLVVWFSGVVTVLLPLVLALVLIFLTHRGRRWMMGKMDNWMKSMKEMERRSTIETSDQNIGNGSKNMTNGPEEEKFMSTNQTSGETNGDFELKIP